MNKMRYSICGAVIGLIAIVIALWQPAVSKWVLLAFGVILIVHSFMCKRCHSCCCGSDCSCECGDSCKKEVKVKKKR